jgi:type II secretory pathway component PulF
MPFFRWQGIDLEGNDRRGTLAARSPSDLDTLLFSQDIALLSHAPIYPRAARSLSLEHKTSLMRQLATLVNAGIYIDHALELVTLQERKKSIQEILHDMFLEVHHGTHLSMALKQYPTIFDSLTIQAIEAGQLSGRLPKTLQALADYYDELLMFRKQIMRAITLPLITAGFFIFVAAIIIFIIMPTFSWLFISFNQELPRATKIMLEISDFLRSWPFLILLLSGISIGLWLWRWHQQKKPQQLWLSWCLWHTPGIGKLIKTIHACRFLQSLAVSLEGGVSIKPALETVRNTLHPLFINQLESALHDVLSGTSLEQALANHPEFFTPEILAYIRIGQETGMLASMLNRAAAKQQQEIAKQLHRIAIIVQPVLMIMLGLWVSALIIAVYLPIFTLSYAVT